MLCGQRQTLRSGQSRCLPSESDPCSTLLRVSLRPAELFVQQATYGLHVEWPCEEKSLRCVDIFGRQPHALAVVLDAFSDGFETKRFAELHHRVDEGQG